MWQYAVGLWRGLTARLSRRARVGRPGPERRQGVRLPSAVRTTCRLAVDPGPESLPAAVRDVSSGGVGLLLDRPMPAGMLLHVELPACGPAVSPLLACVAHAECRGEGAWSVGCSFIRDLNERELRSFLVAPSPSRRPRT
jgi:hypothetical protein